ncbi:hypothetical protein ACUIJ1_09220 [Acinetobacter junii]|uniref:hypothetical protein n=1 Tax=Acinetobacter junii TaxID=40215 RepID=UPI00403DA067
MFVTKELNAMTAVFEGSMPSSLIKEELQLEYVNLEATLLRAKVLRNFAKEKVNRTGFIGDFFI